MCQEGTSEHRRSGGPAGDRLRGGAASLSEELSIPRDEEEG